MTFIFKEGFDQYADTADLFARDPIVGGSTDKVALVDDVAFGVPNGKFLSTNLTKDIGAVYSRSIPLPLDGSNAICFGGTIIVPDVSNPFDGSGYATRPLLQWDNVQIRMGTGALGRQNKLVLFIVEDGQPDDSNTGVLIESTVELLAGGVYYITVGIQGESTGGDDARVVLKVNKTAAIDTGNTVSLSDTTSRRMLRTIGHAQFYGPSAIHAWGFDNLFCVDTIDEPPFFYVEIVPLDSITLGNWSEFGSSETTVEKLSNDDDTDGVNTNSVNNVLRLKFETSLIHRARLTEEVGLRVRMSRSNNGLANAELIINDGATSYGSEIVSVAGGGNNLVEQVINVPLSALKNLSNLNFDFYNRRV